MFEGFTARDFEAFAARKWRSNAFNRERLEVNEKLAALGRLLIPQLQNASAPLAADVAPEHPCLANHHQARRGELFFTRNAAARVELDKLMDRRRGLAAVLDGPSPLRSHLALVIAVSESGVCVALSLPSEAVIDRQNLAGICAEPERQRILLALLHALPAMELGGDTCVSTRDVDASELAAGLSWLASDASRTLTVGGMRERQSATAMGAELAVALAADLEALLPCYRHLCWTRDNDYCQLTEQLPGVLPRPPQRQLARRDNVRITGGMFAGRTGVVESIDGKGTVRVVLGSIPLVLPVEHLQKIDSSG